MWDNRILRRRGGERVSHTKWDRVKNTFSHSLDRRRRLCRRIWYCHLLPSLLCEIWNGGNTQTGFRSLCCHQPCTFSMLVVMGMLIWRLVVWHYIRSKNKAFWWQLDCASSPGKWMDCVEFVMLMIHTSPWLWPSLRAYFPINENMCRVVVQWRHFYWTTDTCTQ